MLFLLFGLQLSLIACEKFAPAGFWNDFHKHLIVENESDQGPWGGHRSMSWKATSGAQFFTDSQIVDYAKPHDWVLVDSFSFSFDTLNLEHFPTLKNDDYSIDLLKEHVFSTLSSGDNKILIFRTGWLNVKPGNATETFENGFAVLNADCSTLKIYHFWGE